LDTPPLRALNDETSVRPRAERSSVIR
jgi:hypothetical protein